MDKNRKIVTIAVITLIVSIISIGIAFAALSQVLTIEGAAAFNPADWNVKFNESSLVKDEVGQGTGTMPIISATTIGTYAVTLTKPGDAVTYTFIVENNGTLDAIIDDFSKPDPVCSGIGDNAEEDASLVCDNLVYTLTNNDENGSDVAIGQILAKKSGTATQQTMVLKIEYPSSMETVPTDDVTITMPQVIMTYVQQ